MQLFFTVYLSIGGVALIFLVCVASYYMRRDYRNKQARAIVVQEAEALLQEAYELYLAGEENHE